MFMDYVTIMLVNMAAGFFVLAAFLCRWPRGEEQKSWAPVFFLTGFVAVAFGLHMSFLWPLPGAYNIAFGEMSVLFGGLFLAAAYSAAKSSDLKPLGIYSFFAGLAAALIGVQFIRLGMTKTPLVSGAGFILSGMAGMLALPVLAGAQMKWLRRVSGAVLALTGLLWARMGYSAYWDHLVSFSAP